MAHSKIGFALTRKQDKTQHQPRVSFIDQQFLEEHHKKQRGNFILQWFEYRSKTKAKHSNRSASNVCDWKSTLLVEFHANNGEW